MFINRIKNKLYCKIEDRSEYLKAFYSIILLKGFFIKNICIVRTFII